MELKSFYREIVNEHNLRPMHRGALEHPDLELRGVNPSCGDDIILQFQVKDGIIEDGGFQGSGCAISQASVDMMLDNCIGRPVEEAIRLAEKFHGMIQGEITDEEELEELEEAAALQDISHMPARVKCAMLGWRTMKEMLEEPEKAKKEDN